MSYNSFISNPASGADSTQAQEQVKGFSSSSSNLNNVVVDEVEEFDLDDYAYDYHTGNPAVYVGSFHKYACGSIFGKWLDLTAFADYDEFIAVCRFLHRDEDAPELMCQDYENFPEVWYSEDIMSEDIFDLIQEFAELDEDEREAFEVYLSAFGSSSDDNTFFDNFREAYQGKWSSEEEFTENLVDELGMLHGAPDFLKSYFNYKQFAYDLFIDDYYFESGYVFRRL